MISRELISLSQICVFVCQYEVLAYKSPPGNNHLRTSFSRDISFPSSSGGARSAIHKEVAGNHDDVSLSTHRRKLKSEVSQQCLNLLAATTNERSQIKKENYHTFTDLMSNGYYTSNGITTYSDLPWTNKYGFVTLSCQCHQRGDPRPNCCEGNRAHLDMSGLDAQNPTNMDESTWDYVADICRVTKDSIGDNVLPPTGELATTETTDTPTDRPTTGAPTSSVPTSSPNVVAISSGGGGTSPPSVAVPTANDAGGAEGDVDTGNKGVDGTTDEGLSSGASLGIALGTFFCVMALLILFLLRSNRDKKNARQQLAGDNDDGSLDDNLNTMPIKDHDVAIDEGNDGDEIAKPISNQILMSMEGEQGRFNKAEGVTNNEDEYGRVVPLPHNPTDATVYSGTTDVSEDVSVDATNDYSEYTAASYD